MNQTMSSTSPQAINTNTKPAHNAKFSVEYFHIYTDEVIGARHEIGLNYLKTIEKTWEFPYERIILIDDYNPTEHLIDVEDVLSYLESHGMRPDYWAYEKDLIDNAQILLESINNPKLQRNYRSYIEKHNKYPCSLLTATWYLTRLGKLENNGIITATTPGVTYSPAPRLLNLLPQDYRSIEDRARGIIQKTDFKDAADKIQDLFYPTDSGRALDLF